MEERHSRSVRDPVELGENNENEKTAQCHRAGIRDENDNENEKTAQCLRAGIRDESVDRLYLSTEIVFLVTEGVFFRKTPRKQKL